MSTFDDLYRTIALPAVFGLHGHTVTYTPRGGTAAPVVAVLGPVADDLLEVGGDHVLHRHRTVEVLTADVPTPGHPDKVAIGGEVWTVREVAGVQGGKARLIVTRPERAESGGRRLGR